jgi:hypothetical protein
MPRAQNHCHNRENQILIIFFSNKVDRIIRQMVLEWQCVSKSLTVAIVAKGIEPTTTKMSIAVDLDSTCNATESFIFLRDDI